MSRPADSNAMGLAEYLGEGAEIGGPYAVLGLKHTPISEAMILNACQARLSQINDHPRSNTPKADEVRMAVHAAASQLLDPQLRIELAKLWPEGTGELASGNQAPKAWQTDSVNRFDTKLRKQAMALLGACGGWNARSRKRLVQFARMHQVPAAQLVEAILGRNGDQEAKNDSVQGESVSSHRGQDWVQGPTLKNPGTEALPWVLVPLVYLLMGVMLLFAGYLKVNADRADAQLATQEVRNEPQSISALTGAASESNPDRAKGVGERRHYSSILFELEKTRREGVFDAAVAEQFSLVCDRLLRQWTEFEPEELKRAVDAVYGTLRGILNPEHFALAARSLETSRQADSILGSALRSWLFGGGDPNASLMMSKSNEIERAGAFDEHLRNAFAAYALTSTDEIQWWEGWLEQLNIFDETDPEIGLAFLLESVNARLMNEQIGDQWVQSSRRIVQAIDWSPESSARGWFMGAIVNPENRSDRLSIFVKALVTHSSAQGLDIGMVIDPEASMAQREDYLKRLRELWSPAQGVGGDDARSQLVERIEFLVRTTNKAVNRDQSIRRTIDFARVNSACWARDSENEAAMYQLMDSFETSFELQSTIDQQLQLSSSANDEQWALDARNLSDAQSLAALIVSLDHVDPIGPKSAHALVYLAMQAPDLDTRALAEQAMLVRRDEPSILIALDRVAGASRTTRRMIELINTYTGSDGSPSDSESARLGILDKLVEIGVLGGDQAIDDYEQEMARLYGFRFRSNDGTREEGVWPAFVAAELNMTANGIAVPDSIHAKLLVRLQHADGPMQRFVAYQSGILDLFAYQLVVDRPALRVRIDQVLLEEMQNRSGQRGVDVFMQMMLVERAMAELWLIQLDAENSK